MNLSQLMAILRGRRREALIVFLLLMAAAIAAALVIPSKYTAQGTVVLNLKTSEASSGISLPGNVISTHIATQIDVAQSERVVARAVDSLGLASDPAWRKKWQDSGKGQEEFNLWAAQRLAKNLKVAPGTESSVLNFSFTDRDPGFAAKFVNAMIQAYIATSLDIRLEPARQYARYYDERAAQLRKNLEQAQEKLVAYQRANGLVVTNEKVNLEVDRLSQMNSRLTALQAAASEASNRSRQSSLTPERMQEALSDSVVASLTEELSRQEIRLREMNARLGDQHPSVIELRTGIQELRNRREAAVQRALGSIRASANVTQAHLQDQERAIRDQQARVMELQTRRLEADVLEREIENARRAYDAVLAKASQAALQSGDTQPDVAILKVATVPVEQRLLHWAKFLAAGAVLASLAALVVAFLRERGDRKVRTARDISNNLGHRVLAVLPAGSPPPSRKPSTLFLSPPPHSPR